MSVLLDSALLTIFSATSSKRLGVSGGSGWSDVPLGREVKCQIKRDCRRKNDSKENTLLLAWPRRHPRISSEMYEHMAANIARLRNYLLGHEKV